MTRTVTFDPSCEYELPAYNADDVNKLFGLSFGFGGVHKNSARFGWRWNKEAQCIDLVAYCYVDGKRNQDEQLRFPVVAQVALTQKVVCYVAQHWQGALVFTVRNEAGGILGTTVVAGLGRDLPQFGLTHGCYFGGELTCPHDMRIQINRA